MNATKEPPFQLNASNPTLNKITGAVILCYCMPSIALYCVTVCPLFYYWKKYNNYFYVLLKIVAVGDVFGLFTMIYIALSVMCQASLIPLWLNSIVMAVFWLLYSLKNSLP